MTTATAAKEHDISKSAGPGGSFTHLDDVPEPKGATRDVQYKPELAVEESKSQMTETVSASQPTSDSPLGSNTDERSQPQDTHVPPRSTRGNQPDER